MSHTTRFKDGWICIHNGDFSGKVSVARAEGPVLVTEEVVLPSWLIVAIAAEMVRRDKISELEQMPDHTIIGLKRSP